MIDDNIDKIFNLFRHAVGSERLAHAYLVLGDPTGSALTFAEKVCAYLLCPATGERPCGACPACRRVAAHTHLDIFRIEPEKKSRIISVEAMRDFMRELRQTSYEGGWKIGLIFFADRFNEKAANAFLKTLEEPPAKTLIFLLTDAPQVLLPTIRSRCQCLTVSGARGKEQASWTEELDSLLTAPDLSDPLAQHILARRMTSLLAEERKNILAEQKELQKKLDEGQEKRSKTVKENEIFDARVEAKLKEVRQRVFHSFLLWQRDLLLLVTGCDEASIFHQDKLDALRTLASKLDLSAAMNRVWSAEEMLTRLNDLSRPEDPILESGFALMGRA